MKSTHLKIPIPTDSYDHPTCDIATLTSIKALITCFDSTMDSFHESIEILMKRLDALSDRTCKIQNLLESLQQAENGQVVVQGGEDKGGGSAKIDGDQPKKERTKMKIAKVTCPALYEHATQMKDVASELYRQSSAISIAKERTGDAIKSLLLEELAINVNENNINSPSTATDTTGAAETTTSTSAKPSDEWLDRASAFEEHSNCYMAVQVDTVSPLLSDNTVKITNNVDKLINSYDAHDAHTVTKDLLSEEVVYYGKYLREEDQEDDKASTSTGNNAIIDTSTLQQSSNRSLTVDYYDDNMSVISEFTRGAVGATVGVGDHNTVISSYSTVSQSGTSASRRRRQRKAMAMAAASSSSMRDTIMKDNTDGKWPSLASSSRQQILSGSMCYVCDLLHDTYGLVSGSNFAQVYPQVKNASDLLDYKETDRCNLAHQQKQQTDTAIVDVTKPPSQQKTRLGLYQLVEETSDQ